MYRKGLKKTLGLRDISDDAGDLDNTSFVITNPMLATNTSPVLWYSSKTSKLCSLGYVNYLMGEAFKTRELQRMILGEK